MSQTNDKPIDRATLIDVQLATAYFPLLVEIARAGELITYGGLVEKAKAAYPDNSVVQKAIAVSTGRRLDIVREFTRQQSLPDISSLVVNQGTGECGSGFLRSFNPETVRDEVLAFDWSEVKLTFTGFVEKRTIRIKPRKKVKEQTAIDQMSAYYYKNKSALLFNAINYREFIIERIMEGSSADEAFSEAASLDK